MLGISASLSTSFHLETNEQSEIVNQDIEKYLYILINYHQNKWSEKLSITQFMANNNNSASIRLSWFFAIRDLHSCISFDIVDFSDTTTRKQINKKKAIDIS